MCIKALYQTNTTPQYAHKQTRDPKNIFSSIHNERQHHTPEAPPKPC